MFRKKDEERLQNMNRQAEEILVNAEWKIVQADYN
jgi:hypothetical protein